MQIELPLWLDYIERQIGFILPKNQHQWLANAINHVAHLYQVTPIQLYNQLSQDDGMHQTLMDHVLITESHFFRDKNALDYIADIYHRHTQMYQLPFVVVSVGCAAGQEVWSLAMELEHKKQAVRLMTGKIPSDYHIVGVDTSQGSLATAKTAQYPERTQNEIPKKYHYYISHSRQVDNSYWQPVDRLRSSVDFVWCNIFDVMSFERLLQQMKRQKPKVILCQNMLIYFRRFDQRDILSRLVDLLDDGGYLILGVGEALFWQHEYMQRLPHTSVNVWQKQHGTKR